ncbi:MAG: GNAT family N-acetyltransferase [Erysipelotrichaceae bacterium]
MLHTEIEPLIQHVSREHGGSFVAFAEEHEIGHMSYFFDERHPCTMVISSTKVSQPYMGFGVGKALFIHMMNYAMAHQLKVRPKCSYVIHQMKLHPEYGIVWDKEQAA